MNTTQITFKQSPSTNPAIIVARYAVGGSVVTESEFARYALMFGARRVSVYRKDGITFHVIQLN